MKILMIAYHFYPDVTPRAFRAFELVKQFAKEGHEVTVLLPESDFDYKDICKKYNFQIDFTDYKKASATTQISTSNVKPSFIKKNVRKILRNGMYCIFPSGRGVKFYFIAVYKKLISYDKEFDMLISIATPFDTHFGVAMALKKNKVLNKTPTKVADYGDPLYKNSALPNCFLYYWLDKFISSQFNFITVPTENARSIYKVFKKSDYIKVIPQGFNLEDTKLATYSKNNVPTFGYAGMFYEKIRNPKTLLEYLLKLHSNGFDFQFVIYTKVENFNNIKLLKKYKDILENKLIINASIPREDVIYKLSEMDFLINIENLSTAQVPSKLIDYALTKRPIFSFNQLSFSQTSFMFFFDGEYSKATEVNLEQFNIKKICNQFLKLNTGS